MKKSLICITALSLLSGCAAIDSIQQMQMDSYRKQCTEYGFTPGTDAFANCVMKQQAQDDRDSQSSMDRQNRIDAAKARNGQD